MTLLESPQAPGVEWRPGLSHGRNPAGRTPGLAAGWILFCAVCGLAGWGLSIAHLLGRVGYLVVFVATAVACAIWLKKEGCLEISGFRLRKLPKRFRRAFPLAFLILASLAILGGILHAPNNYDAMTYRDTRVFHWLAEGRWHWVHTEVNALNTRGCGFEWVAAPLIAFTRTDRLVFLINAICFLLLPGRVFSLLTGLGVRGRAAWYWMWILPTGYCFLLQAGSVGNDLFGALLVFLALEFSLRARRSGRIEHVWLSILAAALMTASKAFNLVLLLPWLAAIWPSLRLLLRRPLLSASLLVVSAVASLLPTMALNLHYCGDWTGLAAENVPQLKGGAPLFHIAVNSLLLLVQNFAPPIFPMAGAWNHLMQRLIPASLAPALQRYFEPDGAGFRLPELQIEEGTGLGFGASVLVLLWVLYSLKQGVPVWRAGWWRQWQKPEILIPVCTLLAALVLMARSGLGVPSRYFACFYPMLFAPLFRLQTGCVMPFRKAIPRAVAGLVFVLGAALLVVSPARPLWPAMSALRALGAENSSNPLLRRTWQVYSVYAQRADAFRPAREIVPPDANPLGLVTYLDPESSLWPPLGWCRILHICERDTPAEIKQRGVKYVLVSGTALNEQYHYSIDDWLKKHDAEVVRRISLELRAARGPADWYLVKMR